MTAEIAILNKSAVALAADSAVTIQTGTGQKIYNSVNKLFALSKYRPVGVMIYGGADFMGIPWESIIKEHRRDLRDRKFDSLLEYVTNFVKWLEEAKVLIPEEHQRTSFDSTVQAYFAGIRDEIITAANAVIQSEGQVTTERAEQIAATVIAKHYAFWESKPKLRTLPEDFGKSVTEKLHPRIEAALAGVFERIPLSADARNKLLDIPGLLYSRDHFSDAHTGFVVAGFGEEEIFPTIVSCLVDPIVESRLKWKQVEIQKITLNMAASIIPFAQREMVDTFLAGIDPKLRRTLNSAFETFLAGLIEQIFQAIPTPALPNKEAALQGLKASVPKIVGNLNQNLNNYISIQHVAPVMNAVAFLPKDELAAMAESLVNLTSFKRRVSIDPETVGGQIDVAVISKGDGFIWIKRKHYFDIGKNPHFMVSCYGERSK